MIEDPMEKEKKAMEFAKARREGRLGDDQDALLAEKKDPNSRQSKAAKLIAGRFGVQVTPEMSAYDVEQLMDPKKMMETQAKAAVDFDNAKRLKQMEINGDLAKVNAGKNTPKGQFDNLPEDKKLTITELAKKNASKVAIKNQIDAVMGGWDKLSEEQQLQQGRQLLKTLNSPEGADAIGQEESKRLGAKLQFSMGNLFNDNPMQFGRDLPGFKQDAMNTSENLGKAMGSNQSIIDQAYGRETGPKKVVKQERNKRTGEVRVTYSDGSTEIKPSTAGN
jgi:hypothetical protein